MSENAYSSVTGPQDIPDNLKVPSGNVLLLQQPGVAGVSISVSGPIIDLSGHNIVPDDLRAITING